MTKGKVELTCQAAKLYYYDFLTNSHDEDSKPLVEHISQCTHCLSEVSRLRETLQAHEVGGTHEQNPPTEDLTQILQLHLLGAGEAISCHHIRPFLPLQSLPNLRVNVPTPVTTQCFGPSRRHKKRSRNASGLWRG